MYGNTYSAVGDVLNNPATFGKNFTFNFKVNIPRFKNLNGEKLRIIFALCTGFNVVDRACCGIGRNQGQITCLPFAMPCFDRNQYVFWDAFHPTEAVNAILARRAVYGSSADCYPINMLNMTLR